MCGIYGRIGERDDKLDQRATQTLIHRGPDDIGLLVDPQGWGDAAVAMGHTRLSIQDLSTAGHQPMRSAEEDLAIVFNGEIYNFLELRAELEAAGCRFRSHSDTEVMLHLYRVHGDAMLDRLEGMYAFALWDRRQKRLLLARDPSGIKPLFYRGDPSPASSGDFSFASEIKALLVDPRFERRPDVRALVGYLTYLYVPPPLTAFEGIRRLEPGHKLVAQSGKMAIERFHRFHTHPKLETMSFDEASDHLEELLLEVVRQHMLADVPVGAFLSGGVDSGLLVALMMRIKQEQGDGTPVRSYTIGFGDEGQIYDESEPAARIAEHLGLTHRAIQVDSDLAADRFHHVAEQFDEPFAIPTALLHDALCEATRKEVTVALAGDGGDEAMAGYPRHRAARSLALYQRILPAGLRRNVVAPLANRLPDRAEGSQALRRARRFLTSAAADFAPIYRGWLTHYNEDELQSLLTEQALGVALGGTSELGDLGVTESTLAEASPESDPLDQACLADVYGFLPNNVLRDSDRSSMRVALEVRVPYADRRVLDFGLRLPTEFKMSGPLAALIPGGRSVSKRLLRSVGARYLPEWNSSAPKQGFVPPMGTWLNGSLQELLRRSTLKSTLAERGLVRGDVVETMRREHEAGRRDRTWNLWTLVVLESWFEKRIDSMVLPHAAASPPKPEVWGPYCE